MGEGKQSAGCANGAKKKVGDFSGVSTIWGLRMGLDNLGKIEKGTVCRGGLREK